MRTSLVLTGFLHPAAELYGGAHRMAAEALFGENWRNVQFVAPPRRAVPVLRLLPEAFDSDCRRPRNAPILRRVMSSILLFTSLFAIPLARQCCLDAALLTGLQIVGVTLDFLDNVLRLYLPLEPAQRIFQRFAFLYANLSQNLPPPNMPLWLMMMITDFDLETKIIFFCRADRVTRRGGRSCPWVGAETAPAVLDRFGQFGLVVLDRRHDYPCLKMHGQGRLWHPESSPEIFS